MSGLSRALWAIALAILLYVGWSRIEDAALARVDRWVERRAAQGLVIGWAGRGVEGTPPSPRVVLRQPRLSGDGWNWAARDLTIKWSWAPFGAMTLAASGDQRVALAGAEPVALSVGDLQISEADPDLLTVARGLRIMGPRGASPPFDLHVRVKLRGALAARPLDAALAEWRDGGGAIDLTDIVIEGRDFRISGDGTLALDREGRPIGALAFELVGGETFFTELASSGLIGREQGVILRLASTEFAAASKPPVELAQGAPPRRLAVTLQDGVIFIGIRRFAELPRLVSRMPVE